MLEFCYMNEIIFDKECECLMVMLYILFSCIFCWKVCVWLEEYDIFYKERNIFFELFSLDEIKEIFCMIEDGIDEIIFICLKMF